MPLNRLPNQQEMQQCSDFINSVREIVNAPVQATDLTHSDAQSIVRRAERYMGFEFRTTTNPYVMLNDVVARAESGKDWKALADGYKRERDELQEKVNRIEDLLDRS